MNNIKRKLVVGVLLLSTIIGLSACGIVKEKPQQNEQQLQCEHEWVELGWNAEWCSNGDGVSFDIYCPKCQWESRVTYTDWKRIQADMEYKKEKEDNE